MLRHVLEPPDVTRKTRALKYAKKRQNDARRRPSFWLKNRFVSLKTFFYVKNVVLALKRFLLAYRFF